MRRNTEVVKTFWGEWAIVYYLDNGFPISADLRTYPFRWMAQFRKWWVENIHGNYIEH
jgi:hypothetical protein